MRLLLPFLFLSLWANAQDFSPSVSIRLAGEARLYDELDDVVPTGGLGIEAKMSSKWTIVGDFTWGSFENINVFTARPDLRYYFKESFKGFFIKAGVGYVSFSAEENTILPFPFDPDDGRDVNFLTLHTGLGFSTIVLERWNAGLHLSLGGAFGTELEEYLAAGFNVGYLF